MAMATYSARLLFHATFQEVARSTYGIQDTSLAALVAEHAWKGIIPSEASVAGGKSDVRIPDSVLETFRECGREAMPTASLAHEIMTILRSTGNDCETSSETKALCEAYADNLSKFLASLRAHDATACDPSSPLPPSPTSPSDRKGKARDPEVGSSSEHTPQRTIQYDPYSLTGSALDGYKAVPVNKPQGYALVPYPNRVAQAHYPNATTAWNPVDAQSFEVPMGYHIVYGAVPFGFAGTEFDPGQDTLLPPPPQPYRIPKVTMEDLFTVQERKDMRGVERDFLKSKGL